MSHEHLHTLAHALILAGLCLILYARIMQRRRK